MRLCCAMCHYFGRNLAYSSKENTCHLHGPVTYQCGYMDDERGMAAYDGWPNVKPDDFCGDFKYKDPNEKPTIHERNYPCCQNCAKSREIGSVDEVFCEFRNANGWRGSTVNIGKECYCDQYKPKGGEI